MPVIGFLNGRGSDDQPQLLAAFHQGLKDNGFVDGQNVTIEYRWAENQYDRLPGMAVDLVRRQVTVLTAAPVFNRKLRSKRQSTPISDARAETSRSVSASTSLIHYHHSETVSSRRSSPVDISTAAWLPFAAPTPRRGTFGPNHIDQNRTVRADFRRRTATPRRLSYVPPRICRTRCRVRPTASPIALRVAPVFRAFAIA
jgi:hypothetical protein